MKIIDENTNQSLSNVTVLLEKNEIAQLIGYLEDLVSCDAHNGHFHLSDDNYSKEITIALYARNGNLDHFADKYRKLILSDK